MNQPRNVPSMSTLCSKAFRSSPSPRKPGKTPQSGIQGLPTNQRPSLSNKAPTHSSLQETPTLHHLYTILTPLSSSSCPDGPPSDFLHLLFSGPLFIPHHPLLYLQIRTGDFNQTVDQTRTVSPWLLLCVPQCPASCCTHSMCEINT